MEIVFTHRTRGVGAEGAHIQGMVEAFRNNGHQVVVDCLPGCNPCEDRQAPRAVVVDCLPGCNPCEDRQAPRAGDGPASIGNRRSIAIQAWIKQASRLIADHSPQFVFGAAELLYNVPLGLRLGPKFLRGPSLVYERYALGNFVTSLLCRALGIPLVVEVNDSVVIERSRINSYSGIKRFLESRILASADLIVTVTHRFKDKLLESFPHLSESKILVLPNAISTRLFDAPPLDAEGLSALRVRLGLGIRTILGTTGQFLPWHGLASLVSVASGLALAEDLGFLFIGDGPVRPEVMEAARLSRVEDRVTFTGMVPHDLVPEYLALLDVAVIPSSNEHCSPMKLMEFMAMSLPVVAPDLPNIREVLEDGRTGLLFRAGDMDDMRRRLAEVLADREAARAMGRRARDHVLANLTWESHARSVLEALARTRAVVEGQPCTS